MAKMVAMSGPDYEEGPNSQVSNTLVFLICVTISCDLIKLSDFFCTFSKYFYALFV